MKLFSVMCLFGLILPNLHAEDIKSPARTDVIVVTPTRTAVSVGEVGSSVTVIDGAEIDRRHAPVLTDLLKFTPGIDVRRAGGVGGQTSIFTRGTNSNHTKVLLDGIDLADPSSPGFTAPMEFLTTGGAGRIEVLRGPQSSLYGSDAIGGVISIETPRGSGPATQRLEQWFGSYGTASSGFTAQAGDDAFHYFVHAGHLESEAFSAKASNTEEDDYRNTTLNSRFGVMLSDEFEIDFFVHHIEANTEFDGFFAPFEDESDSTRTFWKARPRWTFLDGAWISSVNVSYTEQKRDTVEAGAPTHFTGRLIETDWQNDVVISEHQLATFGAVYREETGIKKDGTAFPSPFAADRNALGFYAQDQIAVEEGVHFTPSFRVDDFSDFGTHTTYRFAGSCRETEHRVWRASVGTGYKAPTFDQLFGFGSNPGLMAEESIGFDVGVEQVIDEHQTAIGVTGFYNDVDNLISYEGGVAQNVNVETALIRGAEVFVVVRPAEKVEARVAYTYTDTRAGDVVGFSALAGGSGGRLLRRPLHKASFDLTSRFLNDRGLFTVEVIYAGERDDAGSVMLEDYVLCNLAASVQLNDAWTLLGRFDNVFDVNYQDVSTFNAPGASGYVGLRLDLR